MTIPLRHSRGPLSAINKKVVPSGLCQQLLTLAGWWLAWSCHQRCPATQQPAQISSIPTSAHDSRNLSYSLSHIYRSPTSAGTSAPALTRRSTSMTIPLRHSPGPLSAINIEGCSIGALPAALTLPAWWPRSCHQRCLHPQQPAPASSIPTVAQVGLVPIIVVRTYTVTDRCGGNVSASLTQIFNIDDNTAPTFTGALSAIQH